MHEWERPKIGPLVKVLAAVIAVGAVAMASVALMPSDTGEASAASEQLSTRPMERAPVRPLAEPNDLHGPTQDLQARREIKALRRQLGMLEEALSGARSIHAEPAPATVAPAEPLAADEVDAMLGYALGAEPIDRSWSEPTEVRLGEAFSDVVSEGGELLAVECRTTLCRLDAEYDSLDDVEMFLGAAPHREEFAGQSFYRVIESPDGSAPRVIWYLARPGHALGDLLPTM